MDLGFAKDLLLKSINHNYDNLRDMIGDIFEILNISNEKKVALLLHFYSILFDQVPDQINFFLKENFKVETDWVSIRLSNDQYFRIFQIILESPEGYELLLDAFTTFIESENSQLSNAQLSIFINFLGLAEIKDFLEQMVNDEHEDETSCTCSESEGESESESEGEAETYEETYNEGLLSQFRNHYGSH